MASPNTAGDQQFDTLVQRNSAPRSVSPAPPSLQNAATEKDVAQLREVASIPEQKDRLIESLEWALKVLGFAAACVFGAWAPLSYKATLDGNSGNQDAQNAVVNAAVALKNQARDAASQQSVAASKQRVALDDMNSRMVAVGQLWLYDFCLNHGTSYGPCETFTDSIRMTSLVNYLAATTDTITSSSSSSSPASSSFSFSMSSHLPSQSGSPTYTGNPSGPASRTLMPTATQGSSTGKGSSNLAIPAILGIVFGALIAIGLFLGFWLLKAKKQRYPRALL